MSPRAPDVHEERTIAGYDGAEIILAIYRRPDQTVAGPGVYHIHGGMLDA
ncbi:hypothetical protein [Microbacterium caowuchunii]|nr:hypothetical protein [Microbacterium caowuchunii]